MNKYSENQSWYGKALNNTVNAVKDYTNAHPVKATAGVIGGTALMYALAKNFIRNNSPRRKLPKDILYVDPTTPDATQQPTIPTTSISDYPEIKAGMYKRANTPMVDPNAFSGGYAFLGGMAQKGTEVNNAVAAWVKSQGGITGLINTAIRKGIADPVSYVYRTIDQFGVDLYNAHQQGMKVYRGVQGLPEPGPRQGFWDKVLRRPPQTAPPTQVSTGMANTARFGSKWGVPLALGTAATAATLWYLNRNRNNAINDAMKNPTAPAMEQPVQNSVAPSWYPNSLNKTGMYNPYMYKSAAINPNYWRYAKDLWAQWSKGKGFSGFINNISNIDPGKVSNLNKQGWDAGLAVNRYFRNMWNTFSNGGNSSAMYDASVKPLTQLYGNAKTTLSNLGNNVYNWGNRTYNTGMNMLFPKAASYRVRKVSAFINK